MRDVAVVSFAQSTSFAPDPLHNEVELLLPVVNAAAERSGIPKKEIGFTVSGSCDYLAGAPFSFVSALDAVGAWPPIIESHVEMDGAWALYEAWVRLQVGDIDSALVYAFGKSSVGDINDILALQLDPYYVAPLWPDPVSIAALQARALLESDGYIERNLAEVVARSHRSALSNPSAQRTGETNVEELLSAPYAVSPLREHDCPPVSDGAAVVVLAAGDFARKVSERLPGSPASTIESTPIPSALAILRALRLPSSRPGTQEPTKARSTSPNCTPSSPTRSSSCGNP